MEAYINAASRLLQTGAADIRILEILSKSLDLRDQEQFYYILSLVVGVADTYNNPSAFPLYPPPPAVKPKKIRSDERPIVVGFGPAGMFAALELIDAGLKPRIFERGKKIEERTLDVQKFIRDRELNDESNIQFGEGGAGSYSDGKLFSRRNNNTGPAHQVLQTFIRFGAPPEIAYISKPHLGTDVLCRIVRNIRAHILERGGEIEYEARMTNLLMAGDTATGIVVNDQQEHSGGGIYLALGHSARDTMMMLRDRGVALESRPISVGLRIEHPASIINRMRYGPKYHDFPGLGAATYSLNYTNRASKRGVYTFCMCPGGEVINASSDQGLLVVNGMSYSRRDAFFSNAALVVTCHREDYGTDSPLAGLEFQRHIERKAFVAGGQRWAIPAQNLMNFLGEKGADDLPPSSCRQGIVAADIRDIFPGFVITELRSAFVQWRQQVPSFVSHQALLLGAETRTTAPVKILRNQRYESLSVKNLFPIGEGAGYAGGICSSAADAIRAVAIRLGQ